MVTTIKMIKHEISFLGIIGPNLGVSKSNRLQVVIFWFFL